MERLNRSALSENIGPVVASDAEGLTYLEGDLRGDFRVFLPQGVSVSLQGGPSSHSTISTFLSVVGNHFHCLNKERKYPHPYPFIPSFLHTGFEGVSGNSQDFAAFLMCSLG